MNREQFIDYVYSNFTLTSFSALNSINNILRYAELQSFDEEDLISYLHFMFDSVIDIKEEELAKISLDY